MHDDIEVAPLAAANARFAVGRRAQARAVCDAGRDLNFDPARFLGTPVTPACSAGLVDNFAETVTPRTGLRYLEKSARTDDLAASAAHCAGDRARARRRAGAFAFRAGIQLAD